MGLLTPLLMRQYPIVLDKRGQKSDGDPVVFPVCDKRGPHVIYKFAEPTCRVHEQALHEKFPQSPHDTSQTGMHSIEMRPMPNGETFYLPYGWDEIHSVRLPANPGADPNMPFIRTVITANLSGCCIFIERRSPSNDLIFYHANSVKNSPLAIATATKPREQTWDAIVALNNLYKVASNQYRRPNETVAVAATLPKVEYNAKIDDMVIGAQPLKEHKGKIISFAGGTTVAGFFDGGSWVFWFQTYARIEYYFEDVMGKKAAKAKEKYQAFRVVECRQFYP